MDFTGEKFNVGEGFARSRPPTNEVRSNDFRSFYSVSQWLGGTIARAVQGGHDFGGGKPPASVLAPVLAKPKPAYPRLRIQPCLLGSLQAKGLYCVEYQSQRVLYVLVCVQAFTRTVNFLVISITLPDLLYILQPPPPLADVCLTAQSLDCARCIICRKILGRKSVSDSVKNCGQQTH